MIGVSLVGAMDNYSASAVPVDAHTEMLAGAERRVRWSDTEAGACLAGIVTYSGAEPGRLFREVVPGQHVGGE